MRSERTRPPARGEARPASPTFARRFLIRGAAGLFFVARAARAQPDRPDPLARVARARAQLRSLDGPFTQTRTIALLAMDVLSHGRLTLERPDRLRWELSPPDEVTFWVGPEGLAYRSLHGGGQIPAAAARVGAALDDLRTVIGGDLAKLHQRWLLSVLRDDSSGLLVEAISRTAPAAALHRLRFALESDLVRPTRIELFDGPRDRTVIDFGPLVVNGPVDDARMRPPR